MLKAYSQKYTIKRIREAHLRANTWARHHRKRGLGPTTSPVARGGGHACQAGCGLTLGAPTPQGVARAQSPLAVV
jgi:hypothetical protein